VKKTTLFRVIARFLNAAVILVLCLSVGYLLTERILWQALLEADAYFLGHAFAKDAYRRGEPRLLELSEEGGFGFTGRVEDGLQVWTHPTSRDIWSIPLRVSSEGYVEGWNQAMRRLTSDCRLPHSAIEKRIEELKSDDSYVRFCAADALGRMGPEAEAAVPVLASALKDQDTGVRAAAAEALGKMGPAAKDAAPALTEALQDNNQHVRRYAEYALEQIGR